MTGHSVISVVLDSQYSDSGRETPIATATHPRAQAVGFQSQCRHMRTYSAIHHSWLRPRTALRLFQRRCAAALTMSSQSY